jgi:N-acetylmuramoyl-L-alanine amidase
MEIAHQARADFFISIHADSYRSADAKGATVYVLSAKGATDEASAADRTMPPVWFAMQADP